MVPLLVLEDGTIVDGRRRYWILQEIGEEGIFVPCVVLERGEPDEVVRAEVNVYRRGPYISELLVLAGREAKLEEEHKYREVDEIVMELFRARGIGPRIFRTLVLQTQVYLPPDFEEADFEEESEGVGEDDEYDESFA